MELTTFSSDDEPVMVELKKDKDKEKMSLDTTAGVLEREIDGFNLMNLPVAQILPSGI